MKHVFLSIILFLSTQTLHSQVLLERSYFSIPKNTSYSKVILSGIERLNLQAKGQGNIWDCSILDFEILDTKYVFDKYPDSSSMFSDNTFTLTALEGGTSAKGYELYSMTDGAVLLRGYGMIDESGSRTFEQYDKPYPMLRFPWLLGEGYFVDHPFRTSIRTFAAQGILTLPGGESLSAYKVTESFEEGDIDIIDHFWYADSLPYPIMTITERYQRSDSSLISRTGEMLLRETVSHISEDVKKSFSIMQSGNRIIIPFEHTIMGFYSLSGSGLSFIKHNNHEYQLHDIASGSVFLIYADSQGAYHTHILIVLQ